MLATKWSCTIKKENSTDFIKAIGLDIRKEGTLCTVHNQEETTEALKQRLNEIDEDRICTQEELHNICEEWRSEVNGLQEEINIEFEIVFKEEDNRLQVTKNNICKVLEIKDERINI